LLDGLLVGRQGFAPELVEVGAQLGDPVRIELVDAARAQRAIDHQPGGLEHLEVLRDGGSADRQLAGELADRARAVGEALEDRAPRRIAERGPAFGSVSQHER
jgi:hypothetical protein